MSAYCSNIDPQKFYSVSEVAEMLGCTTECVRQKIKRKELLAARLGRAVRSAFRHSPSHQSCDQKEITKRAKAFLERREGPRN